MENAESEFEYRDRVTARLFPDRLMWFFRIPAMYLTICVAGPLVIWIMGLAGAFPSNVEDIEVIAMVMLSLVGVPLGVATIVWLINRTGFLLRPSTSPRKGVRVVLSILTIAACASIQIVGAIFGASVAGLILIGILVLEFLTAREFADGPRLVPVSDSFRRSYL
jgi:hypothetical protein